MFENNEWGKDGSENWSRRLHWKFFLDKRRCFLRKEFPEYKGIKLFHSQVFELATQAAFIQNVKKSNRTCSISWIYLRLHQKKFSFLTSIFTDSAFLMSSLIRCLHRCWWQIEVGDFVLMIFFDVSDRISILVTIFRCWCPTFMLKDRGCWWREPTSRGCWPNPSPTSQSCRQHISSTHSVTNI